MSSKREALQTVRTVLAADLTCRESDFLHDQITINIAETREERFRYPIREKSLSIVSMGKGAVISCNQERLDWVTHLVEPLSRGQIFSAQTVAKLEEYVQRESQSMAGPDQKYVCTAEDLAEIFVPQGVRVTVYTQDEIVGLYEHTIFQNALTFRIDHPRPDRIATVAECDGKIVGIAGASEDCELMWQIGVDVLPEYQGLGIGKAIVGTLTKAVLDQGVLPFYSTEVSNLLSRRLAVSLGYWLTWVQMYAR
jgi:GNAT superfamily N-acetyltransferase